MNWCWFRHRWVYSARGTVRFCRRHGCRKYQQLIVDFAPFEKWVDV